MQIFVYVPICHMSSAQYVAQMDKPMTVYVSSNVMLARRGKKLYKSQMELVLNQMNTALKGTCVQMIHILNYVFIDLQWW